MKKWMVSILVVALSIGMFVCQGWLMSREGFETVRSTKEEGFWNVVTTERVPRQDADELLAADGKLFLFYESLGYVNVYDTDGAFLYAYQVETIGNGVGGIGYQNGVFYVDGKSGIYGFSEKKLIFQSDRRKDAEYQRVWNIINQPNPVDVDGYTYYYNAEAGQITRAMPGQPLETVVRLPVKDGNVDALAFANIALWAMFALWFKDDGKLPGWAQAYHERKKRLH